MRLNPPGESEALVVAERPTPPNLVEAFDRYDAEWPSVWLVYGDAAAHWKRTDVWHLFVSVQIGRRAANFREYWVIAKKQDRALARMLGRMQSVLPTVVTLYRVTRPITAAQIGRIQEFNARSQRRTETTPVGAEHGLRPAQDR